MTRATQAHDFDIRNRNQFNSIQFNNNNSKEYHMDKPNLTIRLDSKQIVEIINSFNKKVSELDERIERLEDLLNIKNGR